MRSLSTFGASLWINLQIAAINVRIGMLKCERALVFLFVTRLLGIPKRQVMKRIAQAERQRKRREKFTSQAADREE